MGLYFVRHGQTDWNVRGKLQGKSDIALNETGRLQAVETREKLKQVAMDAIYCSPLMRAKRLKLSMCCGSSPYSAMTA